MATAAMLETKQLKIFKTIVEVGSFTRAGARLNLSQPAISQHIRALEEHLGVPVLLRVGKRARPTPAGEVLLHCAEQVLDKIEDAERLLAEQGVGGGGCCGSAVPMPACQHLLPPVLKEFLGQFPRVHLQLTGGHTATTLGRVLAGETRPRPRHPPGRNRPHPRDRDRTRRARGGRPTASTPGRSGGAYRPRTSPTSRSSSDDRESRMTETVLHFLLEEGVFPRVAVEVDQIAVVKELVRLGLGVAVLPAWAVRPEVEAGVLRAVSLGTQGLPRAWCLAALDNGAQPAALKALVRLCVEHLPRLLTA